MRIGDVRVGESIKDFAGLLNYIASSVKFRYKYANCFPESYFGSFCGEFIY